MATIRQIKAGASSYIESELLPHLTGAKRFGSAVYIALAMDGIENRIGEIMSTPAIRVLGLMDENGDIDIDKVHAVAVSQMDREGHIDLDLPVVGRFTFHKSDIDKLYDIIMRS